MSGDLWRLPARAIVRRLRENRTAERPRSALAVTLAASLEVRRAVVFATMAVVLVFVPLLTLGGLAGKFFAPLAASYLLAVVASLGVAITVTPALALMLLGSAPSRREMPRLQSAAVSGARPAGCVRACTALSFAIETWV